MRGQQQTHAVAAASRRSSERALLRDRPASTAAVKRAAVLTADQISAMLAEASPRDAALVVLMCVGAMRVGETTLLAWEDVEGCNVSIPGGVTKTGQSRRFTLPPAACQWLQAWREVCPTTKRGWVFPGQAGQPLSVRGAQTAISKLAEKVLDSTINISPLIYQNQGGIVGIYVARDVDFSSVYELKPVER